MEDLGPIQTKFAEPPPRLSLASGNRELDVAERCQPGNKPRRLEHHADGVRPIAQGAGEITVGSGDYCEERRFPDAGWAVDDTDLSGGKLQSEIAEENSRWMGRAGR